MHKLLSALIQDREFLGKQCSVDSDCRMCDIMDYNTLYCVQQKCTMLVKPGGSCYNPESCSSYSYFGPLACSANCKTGKECDSGFI